MKRFVLALLVPAVLAGCGPSPTVPRVTGGSTGSVTASWLETSSKVQLISAKQRQFPPDSMRVSLAYQVIEKGKAPVTRQLTLVAERTTDKVVFRSGYQPVRVLLNGMDVLGDDETLLMLAREHDALAHHTVAKQEAELVSLTSTMLYDLIH